ncbi:Cupin [Balamuthia mandrillaris]
MKIHSDLTLPAFVDTSALEWVPSPAAGVHRRMIERDGDEVARASSLVKYEAGCCFPSHVHGAGEEFIVLEGVFSDEHGHFGPGAYVRNPINSSHAPFTERGCIIFVKLRQMTDETEETVRKNILKDDSWVGQSSDGTRVMRLFDNPKTGEIVWAERLTEGSSFSRPVPKGGQEIFVLEGLVAVKQLEGEEETAYEMKQHDWLRTPASFEGRQQVFTTNTSGCTLWFKSGHLSVS